MIEVNKKIITAHLDGEKDKAIKALKELLAIDENKLFDKTQVNYSSTAFKYMPYDRKDIQISKSELIENSFNVFYKYHHDITLEELNELKVELIKLPFEKYPVIFLFEEEYIDYGIYHILHFIKDTKYIISHLENKKRYFYSTYKTKVLQTQIKLMEDIKTDIFLYPKSEFDIDIFNTKDKLLQYAEENYNSIFAWNSFTANLNINGIFKDEVLDQVMNDFKNNLNAIKTTKKDAIKSLAILLFKMYDMYIDKEDDYEISIENILRICFKNEIEELNRNKDIPSDYLSTFKVSSKEYKKNSYIFSVFDGINIFGINDKNKYFYFYKMTSEEVMQLHSFWTQKIIYKKEKLSIENTYDNFIYKQLENPHQLLYKRQYPEFFEKHNSTILDQMATIFQEMKKTSPDILS